MNVLLYHPDAATMEMISFCLESQLQVNLVKFTVVKDALERLLQDEPIQLIILREGKESTPLFKYLAAASSTIPLFVIRSENNENRFEFPGLWITEQISPSGLPDSLVLAIRTKLGEIVTATKEAEFCPIHAELLLKVIPLKSDVFIRLSSIKYVKLFSAGTVFTRANLDKLWSLKRLDYLFVKSKETGDFIDKFRTELQNQIDQIKPGDVNALEKVASVQDTVADLIKKVGFTNEVKELARSNVKMAMKSVGSSPKILEVLKSSLMNGNNYVSAHSTALTHVACAVASRMNWPSSSTYQKLVQAALFHDITLTEPELAKIHDRRDLEEKKINLTEAQYREVLNHAEMSAQYLDQFEEVANHVDGIIEQHHERPDGSGFPKGIMANQIAPLSAVFIVAHDIVTEALKQGEKFNMGEFIDKYEQVYKNSPFRQIWRALRDEWKALQGVA